MAFELSKKILKVAVASEILHQKQFVTVVYDGIGGISSNRTTRLMQDGCSTKNDLLNLGITLTKLQQELYCTGRELLFVVLKKIVLN